MTQYKYDDTMKFKYTKDENNEYHSFDDKPSLEYLDGSIISWHKNGVLHRIDKPALIRTLINGNKLEEYYNDGKLHSPNINIPACIDNGIKKLYYMGEELIKDYNELLIKYVHGCSICKKVASCISFYNKKLNKIYCEKCNILNEIEITNFKIKTFTNLEILNVIKDYYNKNNFNNKFIDICNLTENQITYTHNPNFIWMTYYNYNYKNADHSVGIYKIKDNGHTIDEQFNFIQYNNELYIISLLNDNLLNIINENAKFNIDNIYIEFKNEKIYESYKCINTYAFKDCPFNCVDNFVCNISGSKVICNFCNRHQHDSKFITSINGNEDKRYNENRYNFNGQYNVPELLCNYIGISYNEKKSRPQVTKLLNDKFNEAGLIKTRKDDNGKEIKVIILDKTTAKKLKRKEGDEIRNRDIQQFIAQFYKDESMGEFRLINS